MNEIYWITRLESIHNTFEVLLILSIVSLGIFTFIALVNLDEWDSNYTKSSRKFLKACCPVLFISILGTVFIPTTKEALLIYGVGGTIDYVKSNETAKGIPDKAVKALDKFLEEYSKDNKKQNETEK